MEVVKHIDAVAEVFKDIETDYDKIKKQLSEVDLRISDVLHFIEDGGFNAYQGFIFAKKLQELRQDRRKVKDELDRYRTLMTNVVYKNKGTLAEVQAAVMQKKERKYHPRRLTKEGVLKNELRRKSII